MGVGKTSLGKKIANRLQYEFIDTDMLIENKMGISVNEIFDLHGETYFRELEKEQLNEVKEMSKVVISTGGGLPCFNNLMDEILETGITVWLDVPTKIIVNRVTEAKEERPLLKNKSKEELFQFIDEAIDLRSEFYSQAHLRFENVSVNAQKLDQLVDQIRTASI